VNFPDRSLVLAVGVGLSVEVVGEDHCRALGRVPGRLGNGCGGCGRVLVRVLPAAGSDAEELTEWADDMPVELAGVDEASVTPLTPDSGSEGAKGLGVLAGAACWSKWAR
jgi:hypothetical protein